MSDPRTGTDGPRLLCVAPTASIDRLIEVDRLVPGRTHRPDLVVDVPGGPGLTVARSAAALGADVVACPILAGSSGRWIAQALAAEIAAVVPVWSTGETRTAISIRSRDDEALTEILPTPEPVALGTWEALEERVTAELAARPVPVTISGSLPPGVPAYGIARLVRAARSLGLRVIVDAHGESLARALAEHPDLITVRAADAASLLGRPAARDGAASSQIDVRGLAAGVRDRFGGIAVVTSTASGAAAVGPRTGWAIGHAPRTGPYPTGSDDAFLAGLAVALADGESLDAALRAAVAASIANSLQPGAGRLDRTRAEAVAATLEVHEIR